MDVNNKTTLGKIKVLMLKGEKGEQGEGVYDDTELREEVAKISRVNVLAVGANNEGIDCTTQIQQAVNNYSALYFPAGTYKFKNIHLRSDTDIIFDTAVISVAAATDYIFYAESETRNITIKGGIFERTGDTLITSSNAGIFSFTECENVKLTNITFKDSYTANNVRCLDCVNVEIAHCITEEFHSGNFMFLNDCENIYVHDCRIENGTNAGTQYIYPIASGFTDYSAENLKRGIFNFTVENCYINNCDWEGIDSHGGRNIRIVNNRIIDVKERFITVYADNRPYIESGVEWGNVVIENNYCENKITSGATVDLGEGDKVAFLVHGADGSKYRRLKNVVIRNNTLVNPYVHRNYGIASCRTVDNLIFNDNEIIFDYIPSYTYTDGTETITQDYYIALFRLIYDYNAQIKGNWIIGHSAAQSVVRANASTAAIEGNTFISRNGITTAAMVTGVINTVATVAVKPFYYTYSANAGNYAIIDNTPASRLYAAGEWAKNSNGETGRIVALSSVGLRGLTAGGSITGTLTNETTVTISDALNAFVVGEYITVDGVGAIIKAVTPYTFTVDTPLTNSTVNAACTIEFTAHTQRVLFEPSST